MNLKDHLKSLSSERQEKIRQRSNYLILEEKYLRALSELEYYKGGYMEYVDGKRSDAERSYATLRKIHSDLIGEFWQLKYDHRIETEKLKEEIKLLESSLLYCDIAKQDAEEDRDFYREYLDAEY